ncbi:hypothetical protein FACS18948_5460 [Clostridia bacterium]|nr:hypothetical protein FACS18948_5460 [Clostridia bacterium]
MLSEFVKSIRDSLPVLPSFDKAYLPAEAFVRAYEKSLAGQRTSPLVLAVERENGLVASYRLNIHINTDWEDVNEMLIERIVKTLLWAYGGFRVFVGGSTKLGEYIKAAYTAGGIRAFDADFMSGIYEKPFEVVICGADDVPADKSGAKAIGRHLDGCRIGFDAGGSDRKVSAVINGEAVYSEEVVWLPKVNADPAYHYNGIVESFRNAASKMPRVDAIGVSSAGVYVANRAMVASLFLKVPKDAFEREVKDIYIRAARELGDVPLVVANDGDVTALAGAMDLNENGVLGIAMGTSEAGGYVDQDGNITGWLNELAFVPVDFDKDAMMDEWSLDIGCGVKYFSQDAVAKLAPKAGITLADTFTPAEKLKTVQKLGEEGDADALIIFDSIGVYLGYALAYYARFYNYKHVLILGRVTSGEGGTRLLDKARETLKRFAPELADSITVHLPDENNRRVGQSIAAASLPELVRE